VPPELKSESHYLNILYKTKLSTGASTISWALTVLISLILGIYTSSVSVANKSFENVSVEISENIGKKLKFRSQKKLRAD
jgi:hypothetical protein